MAWPGTNGNGHGPVQTRPTKPLEREVAPRYPIPDPPDPDDEYDEDEPDEDDDSGGPVRVSSGLELPRVLPTITVDELRWHARYTAHVAARHAIRIPLYVLRTLRWAPIGVGRAIANEYRWVTDRDSRQLLRWDAEAGDSESYLRVKRVHRQTVRDNRLVLLLVACPLAAIGLVCLYLIPGWTIGAMCGLVWLAGWHGAPRGSIVEHVQPKAPELRKWDPGVIRLAFEAAKLSFPPREGQEAVWGREIQFVSPVRRDGKAGTSAVLELPASYTAEDALKKKAALASGLRVGKVQLDITDDEDNAARIELYIHDEDPYKKPAPVTPLADDVAKWDFWNGVPFGVSARGDEVWVNLLWTHFLIGSMPRVGKSFAARLVASAAALDPYVRLIIYNGRPDGAWTAFEQVAHRYGKGERDDVVDQLIRTLEECCEDVQRRSEKLDEMRDQVPESKITKEISRDRNLNMPLVLLIIDEFHLYVGSKRKFKGRQTCGQRILELLTYLVKVGGAAGYMLILATQKPDTQVAKEITGMRDNMDLSFALRCKTRAAGTAILGEIPPGLSPTQFSKGHYGVGVLIGGQDEAGEIDETGRIVRTYFADDAEIDLILDRAQTLRTKLGVLSGHAAGDKPAEATPDRLLDHIVELTGPGEDRLTPKVVLARLTIEHPDIYSGWTVNVLREHLRGLDVSTSHQINRTTKNGERENLRGIDLNEVKEALARKLAGVGSNGNGSNGNGDR